MSFIFGGNTGTSYEQMLDRRRQASALSQRIGQGGWTALGAGLAGGLLNRSANKAEAQGQQEYLEGDWAAATGGTPALAQAFQQRLTGGQPQEGAGFPASLIQSESGGRWDAQNNEVGSGGARGHFGRLQFGQARLQDAMNAGVIPQGMTPQAFMASPEAQQSVERWHFADIDQQAQARGLDRFMGQNVGGVDVTQDAIRSMAHLGGIGGAQRFLESGGQHNPADANGTSLRDYGQRHGGNATDSAAPQALPGGDTDAIMRAMANPWATDQQRSVLSMMLQDRISQRNAMQAQQAQAADPMRQMQIEQMRLENEALRNPVPEQTSSMRNYQFLIGQGVTPEQARAQAFGGGGVTVNNNMGDGAPDLGKLSTDFGYVLDPATGKPVIDPATGLPTAAPVPGSPAARGIAEAAKKANDRTTNAASSANVVLQDIDKAIGQVSGWTSGPGSALAGIPGSGARDLRSSLDTVRANIGFDRLQQMREASPTGGALGGIAIQELEMLQAVLGSLDTAQSPTQLKANLERLRQVYAPISAKAAAYPNAASFGFGSPQEQSAPQAGLSDDDYLKSLGLE